LQNFAQKRTLNLLSIATNGYKGDHFIFYLTKTNLLKVLKVLNSHGLGAPLKKNKNSSQNNLIRE
jgi:hypothetical protein